MPSAEAQPDGQITRQLQPVRQHLAAQLHLPDPAADLRHAALLDDQGLGPARRRTASSTRATTSTTAASTCTFQLPARTRGLAAVGGAGLARLPRHRRLFERVPGGHEDRRRGLHADRRPRLGPAERRRRLREPVLRRSPTASAPATNDFGEGGKLDFGRLLPRRGRRRSSAASSGGRPTKFDAEGGVFVRRLRRASSRARPRTSSASRTLNFGAEYRWREGVTLGGYYMYGSTRSASTSWSAATR